MTTPTTNTSLPLSGAETTENEEKSCADSKTKGRKLPNTPAQSEEGTGLKATLSPDKGSLSPIGGNKNSDLTEPTDTFKLHHQPSASFPDASFPSHSQSTSDDAAPTAAGNQRQMASTQPEPGAVAKSEVDQLSDDIHNRLCLTEATETTKDTGSLQGATACSSQAHMTESKSDQVKLQYLHNPSTTRSSLQKEKQGSISTEQPAVQMQARDEGLPVQHPGIKLIFHLENEEGSDFEHLRHYPGPIKERKWILLHKSEKLLSFPQFQNGVFIQYEGNLITVINKRKECDANTWITECVQLIFRCFLEIETAIIDGRDARRVAKVVSDKFSNDNSIHYFMAHSKDYIELYAIESSRMDAVMKQIENILDAGTSRLHLKVPVPHTEFEMLSCLAFDEYVRSLNIGRCVKIHFDHEEPSLVLESTVEFCREFRNEKQKFLKKHVSIPLTLTDLEKRLLFDARYLFLLKLKDAGFRCWLTESSGQVVLWASEDKLAHLASKHLKSHLIEVFSLPHAKRVMKALDNLKRSVEYACFFAFCVAEDGQKIQIAAAADIAQNLRKYLETSFEPLEQENQSTQPQTEVSAMADVEMQERKFATFFEEPCRSHHGDTVVTAPTTVNPCTDQSLREPQENSSVCQTKQRTVPAKSQTQPDSIVDELVVDLLKLDKNLNVFKLQLYEKKCNAELRSLPEGSFLHVNYGDPSVVSEVIGQLFHTEKFESDVDDEKLQKELKDFQSKHSESMTFCLKSNTWFVCFTTDICESISEKLQEWKKSHHSVVLPLYAYDFILLKQDSFTKHLKEHVHPSVELQLSRVGEQYDVSGLLSGDRGHTRKAVECLQRVILGLETDEENIDIHHAVSLQGVKNQRFLQEMEAKCNCRIDIQQTGKSTVTWMSPEGHLLQVCENSIVTSDCNFMVLPLSDEQKQWPPVHHFLLKKSFLSDDLQTYHDAVGKETPLLLQCNNKDFGGQTIAVVSVPAKWDDGQNKERERIMKAYQQIFSACKGDRLSLAVLARQSPKMELVKPLKAIMKTIFDTFSDADSSFRTVVIYTDNSQETEDVCRIVNRGLPEGWTSRPVRVTRPALRKRMIQTDIGEIQNTLADVIVNSTRSDLKVSKGAVERAIHDAAGPKLKQECEKTYPKGIPESGVAITDSFNMTNTKRIYHVALAENWPNDTADPEKCATLLGNLSRVMRCCLLQASWENHTSIAFPTLGSGQLAYPCDVVARTMFSTINKFFKEMPNSSLETVIIVIFSQNRKAIQEFKKEEISHLYTFTDDGGLKDKHGLLMTLGQHIIQVVHGNADQKPCVAEVCIRGELASEKSHEMGQKKDEKKDTFILKHFNAVDYKYALQKALDHAGVTVQVLAQTLRFTSFTMQEFVKELEGLLERKTKSEKLVSVIFADEEKMGTFSNSFRAVEKGHIDFSEGQLKRGQIYICAPAIGKIEEKVMSLPVLPRLKDSAFLQELKVQTSDGGNEVRSRSETQKTAIRAKGDTVSHPEGLVGDVKRVLTDLLQEKQCTKEDICQALTVVCEDFESKPFVEQKIIDTEKEAKLEEKTSLGRELEKLTVEALRYLMGDEFAQALDVQESKGICSVTLKGASSHDVMSKVDSLRREDVPLSSSEMMKIGDVVDVRKEGIEAFVRAVPDQSKAAIFAFDYNAITKAKHLVAVKAGRVKVTARARRRFDPGSSGQEGTEDLSPPQSLGSGSLQSGSSVGTADFFTSSGIKVSVYKTDITKLPVDAIVNAANEQLAHGGGVAHAIANAAGYDLEEEGQEYIRKHGPLKVSKVAVTTGGSLPCKKVLHAVGPRWHDYSDKEKCQQDLVDTVYNCLAEADNLGLHTLAIPSISSAIFGVPQKVCADSYLAGVKKFDDQHGKVTSLKHVHFVDVSDAMVTIIQDTFRSQWHLPMPNLGAYHFHYSSVPDGNTEGARNRLSAGPTETMSNSTNETARPEKNTAQEPVPQPQGKKKRHSDPVGTPFLKVVGEEKDCQFEFHFKDLDLVLIFKNAAVTDAQADAVIFWQDVQNPLKDAPFKHFEKKMTSQSKRKVSDLKKKMVKEETVHSVEGVSQLLVFAVYSTQTFCEKEKARKLATEALNKVEIGKRTSVAVPRIGKKQKEKKEINKDLDNFVTGLYMAVKDYSARPQRSITKIYILDTDQTTLKTMIYAVSDLIAIERSLLDQESTEPPVDICVICREEPLQPKALSCSHTFCSDCIETWLKEKRICPICGCIQGILHGNQPDHGTMKMKYQLFPLPGFDDVGSYHITYHFKSGPQADMHPQPGRYLQGIYRDAYLPDTTQGRTVLMLLKVAFDRRLIFTVGESATNGDVGIIWNDIHHKTKMFGGPPNYGYPDPGYLARVQKELEGKGVTEKDLSDLQTDFIRNPKKHQHPFDFSKSFSTKESAV